MKKYLALFVVGLAAFMALKPIIAAQRGYETIGGEGALLLLPLWYWYGHLIAEQIREDRKEGWK